MAKAKKEAPKAKAKDEGETFEFTVADLEKATGLQPASIRVGLRESEFGRSGKQWGWNSKKEFDEVVAFFKERSDRKPATGGKDTAKKAPAKKADAKPTRKKK